MATNASQILNASELEKKLGGSSGLSLTICPNKSQISSIWSNVYFLTSGSNILLNNGEIWPTKHLKKGQSLSAAYHSSSYETINFRDDEWDSGSDYTYGTNCTAYNGSSYASNGYYYMEDTTNKWYLISRYGAVTSTGIYTPPYFSFNVPSVQLGIRNTASTTVGYSSSTDNISTTDKTHYDLNGDVGGSSNINISFNNGTATIQRNSSYDASYPMVVITSGVTNSYDKILVYPPWSLSASDITNVSSNGATVTPVVSTNMGDYTLSKVGTINWITISGNQLIVQSNDGNLRSCTIRATARVNASWGGISYDSGNIYDDFTVTQNAYVNPYSITLDSSDWEYVLGDSDTFTLGITTTGAGWEVSSYSSTYFSISPTYNNSTGTTYATIRALRRKVGDSLDIIFRSRGDSSKTATFTVWYLE